MRKCKYCGNTARLDSDMCTRCELELEKQAEKARMREAIIAEASTYGNPLKDGIHRLLDYIDGNYYS